MVADRRAQTAVVTLYKFVQLPDRRRLREDLRRLCARSGLKGTLLLAEEGINGTVSGAATGVRALLDFLRRDGRFAGLECKWSVADTQPFYRMKIKLKKEIVSMGIAGVKPAELTGTRVGHQRWNELVADPQVLVLDVRNDYEHKIGSFKNAVAPGIKTFRDFPGFVDRHLRPDQHRRVAMFCTGGIRCEKAGNYLLSKNFKEVCQLDGGILKYLQAVNEHGGENLWHGECFVFDGRVAVDKELMPGHYTQCFACRMPLADPERESPDYVRGISCPYCIGSLTGRKYRRFSERQRQMELAERDGRQHIACPGKA